MEENLNSNELVFLNTYPRSIKEFKTIPVPWPKANN
uniref:Uncharacterized protein n=1 Tax=Coprothermobacter proteolyticus (strain ATCC 35245 / DSM 5265 / OCM 4 / BT) TaxID=309798 RepID=B5YA32_COPPD